MDSLLYLLMGLACLVVGYVARKPAPNPEVIEIERMVRRHIAIQLKQLTAHRDTALLSEIMSIVEGK